MRVKAARCACRGLLIGCSFKCSSTSLRTICKATTSSATDLKSSDESLQDLYTCHAKVGIVTKSPRLNPKLMAIISTKAHVPERHSHTQSRPERAISNAKGEILGGFGSGSLHGHGGAGNGGVSLRRSSKAHSHAHIFSPVQSASPARIE